ncbi:3-beta hydroxysteroid dehydrogenase isomerase family [Mycena venus]|uniref:3-beta hydroxysteroid dehydrogenase isomerase family n=1 Tax=Mycena venus TaxID=2733690 RepID=A0A8H6YR18_9AGAR|nr:3-beta hydroxysteroid dehydrogenase isomerase family [Mycena venus]
MNSQCNLCRSPLSSSLLPTPTQTEQVLDLLRTNSLPTDSSRWHSIIASSAADVARYDTKIGRLREVMNRLVSERDALQQYGNQCRSVFAPVRRLPPEILAEIFALCCPTPALYCDNIPYKPVGQSHLVTLLQVCSAWYSTVMETPSLWAIIEVDPDNPYPAIPNKSLRDVSHIRRSLNRSGHHPLIVQLVSSDRRVSSGLELLASCADRWRIADMHIDIAASSFLSRLRGNFPLLERLALGGDGAEGLNIFETAPSLMHVILSDVDGALPKLPWSQLREVTYYASHPAVLDERIIANRLAFISHCSDQCEFNIYSLNLSALDPLAPHFSQQQIQSNIPILRLGILDRYGEEHSRPALGQIIGSLTLPNLRELHFRSTSPKDPLFWPHDFNLFSSRSSLRETLTKLFLYDMVITENELVHCLSDMHVLQELFVQDVGGDDDDHILITDTLLQRLTWRADSSCLVPNLHDFSFASLFFFDDDDFIEFVESRLVPGRTQNGPLRIEAFAIIDAEPGLGIVGVGLGAVAVGRMAVLQTQGLIRWSKHGSKHFRKKSTLNVHVL